MQQKYFLAFSKKDEEQGFYVKVRPKGLTGFRFTYNLHSNKLYASRLTALEAWFHMLVYRLCIIKNNKGKRLPLKTLGPIYKLAK
jgi:hypothetical protein